MSRKQIAIDAVVAAPPEKVWQCWTAPEHITHWNFASDDWYCPGAENDLKVGGRFKYRMEAKDGSFGFDLEGAYDEVSILKKLTYTMDDRRKATTMFKAQGGSTKVSTTFDAEDENSIDMQRDGWQAILNNFKAYVESQQPEMNRSDERPDVGIAHVVLETDRMEASSEFMRTIGTRSVYEGPQVSVFELRGGTHLLLMAKEEVNGGDAAFDLMVDDIHATHERFTALGLDPSPIEPRPQIDHEVFTVREPSGHVITIFSSHVTAVV